MCNEPENNIRWKYAKEWRIKIKTWTRNIIYLCDTGGI